MLAAARDNDLLTLLSLIARGLGATGLDDYQPPSERWDDAVEDARVEGGPARDPGQRRAEVLAFIAATEGETG